MSNLLRKLTVAGLMAAPLAAMAAPAPAKPAPPTLSDVLKVSGISLSGAVDASYDWADVDGPQNGGGALTLRQFDINNNSFSLHQVNLLVAKDFGDGIGVTINPVLGDDANIISGGGTDDFDLTQAFVSYTNGGLTVIGGRFVTLAGAEVIMPSGNMNASRSLLFFNQPLLHTGVRATEKLGDLLSVTVGVNNAGYGTGKVDSDTDKTIETQVALTPTSALAIYLTGYSGQGDASPAIPSGGGLKQRSDYVDLVTTFTLNDMFNFAVNADYANTEVAGFGGSDSFMGVAAYANAKLLPKFRVAVRGEYLSFDDGNYHSSWQKEATLTAGYSLTDSAELIAEVRQDVVDSDGTFRTNSRNAAATPVTVNDDQTTATIKAIVKF